MDPQTIHDGQLPPSEPIPHAAPAEGTEKTAAEERPERRAGARYAVDEACVVVLLRQGASMPCHVLNLSLDGCLIRTRERFTAGIQIRLEVSFKVNGIAFRFNGVSRWTNGRDLVGIAFVDALPRRRQHLAEVLAEMDEAKPVGAGPQKAELAVQPPDGPGVDTAQSARPGILAAESPSPEQKVPHSRVEILKVKHEEDPAPGVERPAPQDSKQPQSAARGMQHAFVPDGGETRKIEPAPAPAAHTGQRERRAQSRHPVDTTAIIHMVRAGLQLRGRIQDVSASGCRIRTDEPFPVGIFTRVETEFRAEGLPFRLGGVIQSIHDRQRHLVGIRFLDMSERKRDQLATLIAEIEELAAQPVPRRVVRPGGLEREG